VTTDPDGTETRSAPVADEGPGVGHSGDPVVVDTQRSSTGTEAGTAGPTADAAGSTSAGVTGFGTDTGMSSDDPASGSFTGDPGARTGSYGGSDDPDSRGETVRTSTGPGERSSGEGGALRAEPGGATADLPEHEVLERDFADRDITEHGGVQRDFANREIDDDEVPSQGFATGQRTLDDPDRPISDQSVAAGMAANCAES